LISFENLTPEERTQAKNKEAARKFMGSYHGPKAKVMRRFGLALIPRPKYQKILERRGYPPGQHGRDKEFRGSRRRSDYGIQLKADDEATKHVFASLRSLARYVDSHRVSPPGT